MRENEVGSLRGRVLRMVSPGRKLLSRAALVPSERHERAVADLEVEHRVLRRVNLILEELWKRMESATSRNATELQKLREEVERLQERQQTMYEQLAAGNGARPRRAGARRAGDEVAAVEPPVEASAAEGA